MAPRRPAFLELFFDLVFFFAFIALAQKLIDRLTWAGTAQTLILLLAFSLIWALTAWLADTFDLNRPTIQAQIIGVMFGGLVMAAAVPGAFGPHGVLFAVAYVSIHFGSTGYYTLIARQRELRGRNLRVIFWLCLSAPAWIVGASIGGTTRGVLWAVAITLEYTGATLGWPTPWLGRSASAEWRLVGERIAERYRQFLIIALGVTIFVAASAFSRGDFSTGQILAFGVVFVITVLLWRIYIHRAGELLTNAIATAVNPSRFSQFAVVAHLIMVAGVLMISAASQLIAERPFGGTPVSWGTVILGGPAMFLLGRALLDYTVFSRVSWSRPAGLVLLAAVVPAVPLLPPVMLAVVTMLILLGIAVANLITTRTNPPIPAPPVVS
jgi:low temperature requirement protein LtrA